MGLFFREWRTRKGKLPIKKQNKSNTNREGFSKIKIKLDKSQLTIKQYKEYIETKKELISEESKKIEELDKNPIKRNGDNLISSLKKNLK